MERYDPEHKISVATEAEKFQQLQWLFFQASGQGPYFGQGVWFTRLHSEQLPSAQERYRNEIKRVWSVLESVLSKQEWLVGGKCTIADMSFIQSVMGYQFVGNHDETHPYVAGTTSLSPTWSKLTLPRNIQPSLRKYRYLLLL